MHQSVQQWWTMPEGNPWSYTPVLHTFQVSTRNCSKAPRLRMGQRAAGTDHWLPCAGEQRIVELQESWRIMVEFNTHGGPGQQYQEHKVRGVQGSPQQLRRSRAGLHVSHRRFARRGSCALQMNGSRFSGGHSS